MTDEQVDRHGSLSRRQLITGGAIAATAGVALSAVPAKAANGDALALGQENTATRQTVLTNTQSGSTFAAWATDGTAIAGVSPLGNGVGADGQFGVLAQGTIVGVSGYGPVGVQGSASPGADSKGLFGQTADGGIAVHALDQLGNGTSLRVDGRAVFSRSGVVNIAYPAKSVTVSGVPVNSKSLVLVTLQNYVSDVYVVAAVPMLTGSSNSFTIFLNKTPGTFYAPRRVAAGWFVVEHP